MKPIRYTEAMIQEFLGDGFWTKETFFDFYEKNAAELPDREALVDSRYRVTWAEARDLTNAIATAWVESGLPKDSRVIIQSPNSVYGFLARIAAERAGLVSLTVYPYLRQRELEYMVEITEAKMVVIPHIYRKFDYIEMYKELMARFPALKQIYLFDETVPESAPSGTKSLIQEAQKYLGKADPKLLDKRRLDATGDVGLLTSTTGTTGIPKLVEWPISPRVCTAKGRVQIWDLTEKDITMAVAPHAGGAAGTLTYFAAPMAGAKTVMLEEFDPKTALEVMAREKVTAIGVVPTHLVRMLEQDIESFDLGALRFIRSAGGYLPPKVANEAEDRFKAVITSDLGTQDVGSVSGCRVSDSVLLRRSTVGRPLPGNVVKILDDDGNEVPGGKPGQLWFRGPHAPAGYYRDPKLTSGVFDQNGWATTGDIVKLDQDCLWIMGRKKDMIIRGGQNIYPAEIEGLLNNHPAVSSVAVVGMPDEEMGEKACAYVTPKGGMAFTFDDMKTFLLDKNIAKYKLPERLELTLEMPTVGDSGKINKEVLKEDIARKLGQGMH
ncbi:AMP-binding protein [Dethiosulfatarculus sandiegensis]|uniref:O-succinylbenzoate-CoA ligase n=1 Tax=Dethiosulfatarculus sandiegensis TaxID=1429043 RepID=A0A0D2JSU4_9BACT|nr:AMP-binding protein [Dethiosulfatarculus sandiegensis]KIX12525.1 O-succinylbenzoate-CoA ligase [Dethiosulfatarculus sandiegensis]